MFLSSLHFSVTTSSYSGFNLKPKQVKCLEALYFRKDVVAVLPTGYGKSMIFHLLPSLFYDKMKRTAPSPSLRPVVIVVSPLNALIKDQIRRTEEGNLKAAILSVKRNSRRSRGICRLISTIEIWTFWKVQSTISCLLIPRRLFLARKEWKFFRVHCIRAQFKYSLSMRHTVF